MNKINRHLFLRFLGGNQTQDQRENCTLWSLIRRNKSKRSHLLSSPLFLALQGKPYQKLYCIIVFVFFFFFGTSYCGNLLYMSLYQTITIFSIFNQRSLYSILGLEEFFSCWTDSGRFMVCEFSDNLKNRFFPLIFLKPC